MSHVPQATPEILATHISPKASSFSAAALTDVSAAGSDLLLRSASGEDPSPDLKPTSGGAAIQGETPSSVSLVPAEGRLINTQDHTDAKASIRERPPIGIAAGDGETVPSASPMSPLPHNIKYTLGVRPELTAVVLEVKSASTAAVTSTFDPSSTHHPSLTTLENPARHECQLSSARSPIWEELASKIKPQNAISPVGVESQPRNRVGTKDQGRKVENSETAQGRSNIQDGNNPSEEELTPQQKRTLRATLKKEKKEAEQREEAERVNNEKERFERVKEEKKLARRIKKEREQAEMRL